MYFEISDYGVSAPFIEKLAEVHMLPQDVTVMVRGYQHDADGNIVLDDDGLPIPVETTDEETLRNSIQVRADINRDGFITVQDKIVLEDIFNRALDVNGDGFINVTDLSRLSDVMGFNRV